MAAKEREWSGGERGGELGGVGSAWGSSASTLGRAGHVAKEVAHRAMHGRHAQGTCRPLEHFPKHVAENGVAGVGGDFGPLSV